MKICVVGLGYIGLPTAALFSSLGHQVVGVDVKEDIVNMLNRGEIHIEEPGLESLVNESVMKGSFYASTTPEEADVYVIAVPTPNNNDHLMGCDLTYVIQACNSILPYIRKGNLVIVESTMAPRSMEDFIKPLFDSEGYIIGDDIYLAHCPERVLPGRILHELVYNNRIVGGITEACTNVASDFYRQFVKGEVIETEAKTAEMAKCAENIYRDVNIALANELAKICGHLEINILDVINIANQHPRVNIHQPGPGVGGHCLAVDPYFVYSKAPHYAKLIKMARDINNSMPQYVVDIIAELLKDLRDPKISIFGVSYKGNVDDTRQSPALDVIRLLREQGFNLAIHDPHVNNPEYTTMEEAAHNSDLIVVLTDHQEFRHLDHSKISKLMRTPMLLDTRDIVEVQSDSDINIINYGNISNYKKIEKGGLYEISG